MDNSTDEYESNGKFSSAFGWVLLVFSGILAILPIGATVYAVFVLLTVGVEGTVLLLPGRWGRAWQPTPVVIGGLFYAVIAVAASGLFFKVLKDHRTPSKKP